MKLGHVHLKVSDLKKAELFYTDLLGFKVTERVNDKYVFLTQGKAHHDLALQSVGQNAGKPEPNEVGLYHVAYEVNGRNALRRLYKNLQSKNIIMRLVDHGISQAIYFDDPDGNGIEVFVDTRDKRSLWQGRSDVLEL